MDGNSREDSDHVDFTDVRDSLDFPWSEYTLPDDYNPIIQSTELASSSPVSGNSAATDPFDVEHQSVTTDALFVPGGTTPNKAITPPAKSRDQSNSNKSSFSDKGSSNSIGFDFTELEGDGGNLQFNSTFAMPDMGFFGVASPPNSHKVADWMSRDAGHHIPIFRHRQGSGDSETFGPQIPIRRNSSEGIDVIASPRSIPNSPPQSPLYKRQSHKAAKIFEDINENYQLINSPSLFLQSKKCYDLIPMSGKLIVFDKKLLVRKAFTALIANGTRAAPIWDSSTQSYTGMLTITDFITILDYFYNEKGQYRIDTIIENKTIEEFKDISERNHRTTKLISIDPTETLFTAAKMLLEMKIHRLAVIDPRSGNTLYILTHKRILNHIYPYLIESTLDTYFACSITELGVGTYEDVKQLKYDSKLVDAIGFFARTRVSAIPIIDDDKKVVDIYARFDVITLASRGKYNDMDMTIRECLQLRSSEKVDVLTCKSDDSLIDVIKAIYSAQVHRLVVVDSNRHVVGLVSLSDLFWFLCFRSDRPSIEEEEENEQEEFNKQFDFG